MLPKTSTPRREVTLATGETCEIRGLTRGEVTALQKDEDSDAALVCYLFGCTRGEAKEWISQVSQQDWATIEDAVLDLSGLRDGQGKP